MVVGRRGPVDLRLPRRQHPQHPRLRAGLPQRHVDPAGAELPLHPDHPQRRQRGDRPQRRPQAQAAVVRRRRRSRHRGVRRRRRARRGAVRRPGRSTSSPTRGRPDPVTWPCSTAPTRSPGCSRRPSSAPAWPTGWSGACASTSGARSATSLAYLRMLANPADEISLRRVLNTPRRGIGDRAEAWVAALAEREGLTFWEALRRADEAPGLATRSLNADPRVRRPGRGAAVDGRRGRAPRRDRGVGARAHRLPRRAGGLRRPAGRHPGREPRRAGGGGPRVLRRPGRRARRPTRPTSTPAP